MPTSPRRRPMIGRVLDGRYRVLAHIADGGMATVWRALDERLEREVAVKVLRPALAEDPVLVARFRAEARAAARLNDPRIVAVYDQGSDDGDFFLAMELVPGSTLREIIHRQAPLPAPAALDILEPVAEALGVAHAAGLLHRDVKPENVIVRDDGQVKVADFGLARAVSAATTAVTGAATMLGTVSYLSPEQVEHGRSDARSDVYALGIVAFEMLTGRKPHDGDSPIHVAYQHVHGTVPPPSGLVASVPPALDDLVARLTARNPAERPADGRAAADAVRAARRPREAMTTPTVAMPRPSPAAAVAAVAAPTETIQRETPPAPRRRRVLPAALLALLLAGGGGGTGWYYLAGPGATTTVPEVTRIAAAEATARLADAHLDVTTTEAFSETVPRGAVVAASPTSGTTLHRGDDVALTISRGPERYAVPVLVRRSLADASAALTAAHLRAGEVREDYDESVPRGAVVSSDPGAQVSLRPGTAVSLVVSKGRRPIDVPRLTGLSLAKATATAQAAGLVVATAPTQVYSTTTPKGSVVSQSPTSGRVYGGDTITVTLSKGPEMVTVPGVVGHSLDAARSELEAAGFTVAVSDVFGGMFGLVREQSVQGGSQAPKGSTITLTIV